MANSNITLIPVDHDPFGPDSLASKAYHTIVDPWTAPLGAYQGKILPFSAGANGKPWFDPSAGMLGGLQSGATLPHDVMTGQVDPNSPEGFARTQNLAGLLSGGPLATGELGGAKAAVGWNKTWPGVHKLIEGSTPEQQAKLLENLHKLHPVVSADQLGTNHPLAWTAGKTPEELLAHNWVLPGGNLDLSDPTQVAQMLTAAHKGDQKGALDYFQAHKNGENLATEPWGYFKDAEPHYLNDIEEMLKYPKLTQENNMPLPLTDNQSVLMEALVDKLDPAGWQENAPGVAASVFHSWLSDAHPTAFPSDFHPDIQKALDGLNPAKASAPAYQSSGKLPPSLPPSPAPQVYSGIGPSLPRPAIIHPDVAPVLQPVDWQSLSSNYLKSQGGLGNMKGELGLDRPSSLFGTTITPEEYINHLQSLGFNPNLPLFKGISQGGEQWMRTGAFPNPITKPNERGLFFSDKPKIAGEYGNVDPYFARAENPFSVSFPDVTGASSVYSPTAMQRTIETARGKGADALLVHNIDDVGGNQTQYIFMDPNRLRNPWAEFDPAKLQSPILTHVGGLPITLLPVDHDPWQGEEQSQ